MRYYDIGARIAPFTVVAPHTVTAGTSTVFSAGTDQTAATNAVLPIDRTGFYSYMVHISARTALDANTETLTLSSKLQSSTGSTSAALFTAGVSDVTSVTTTDANYKQFFLNTTGAVATTNNLVPLAGVAGGQFKDQPFVYTAPQDMTTYNGVVDARYWGSLRDARVTGKYIAPWVTVADTEDTGTITWISVELLLGAGDTMPVMEGGTAGTNSYYSKGQ
jgi:hypothetical protein